MAKVPEQPKHGEEVEPIITDPPPPVDPMPAPGDLEEPADPEPIG